MKQVDISPEEAMKQIQKIFKKRGTKAFEMARNEILQEKIECKEAREALSYFMNEYWHDLARPSLLSLVCEAVGGDPKITTPIAIPMILISGAIDIHDDIIDQSKLKEGRPTVYGKFGKDIALLVGDALLFKGLLLLNKAVEKGIPAEKMPLIMDIIKDMFFELGDAEAMELSLRRRMDISPEKYLQIVRRKAADVEAHTRIGTILGGGSMGEIEAVGQYGRLLGMMIILRDDWIDILDVEESHRRVKNEALPILILYGLQEPMVKTKLRSIIENKPFTKRDAESILEIILKADALRKYYKLMYRLAADAFSKLEKQKYDLRYLRLLVEATLPLQAYRKKQ